MNTNTKPTTSAVLHIGEHAFEIPSAKLPDAYKLLQFLSELPAYKEEYAGSYVEGASVGYCLVSNEAPTLGLEIKPRVKLTREEYTKLREAYYARVDESRKKAEAEKGAVAAK